MAWFDTDWAYRQKLTVDKDKVDSTESDFPILIDLSDMDSDFWDNVKADGGDIRITQSNGTTQQAVELKNFNQGANTGQVYFKASSLSSVADTDFYVYYGNAAASQPARNATYGSDNVWDSNFTAVYHLEEDPSGSAPQIVDSTVNANDGTTEGGMTSGDLVAAIAGNGLDFDGVNDAADMGFQVTSNTGTVEMQVSGSITTADTIIAQNASTDGFVGWGCQVETGSFIGLHLGATGTLKVKAAISLDTWASLAFTWDNAGNTTEAWKDGVSVDTSTGGSPTNNTQNVHIAGFNYSAGTVLEWAGKQDEIRVSDIVRSDGWIKTTYNSIGSPSTFYSFSGQETSFTPQIIMWY
jgi:hypothetical protein